MENKVIDLQEFNMSDEELFSYVDNNKLESEKITAPRYSYWKSVFRVFFRDKINIILLSVLLLVIVFAYIYPMCITYDPQLSTNSDSAYTISSARAAPVNLRLTRFGQAREFQSASHSCARLSI